MTSIASTAMIGPPDLEALMARKAQIFVFYAIDRYLGACARRNLAAATRAKYQDVLYKFGETVEHKTVIEITGDDCGRFLDRYQDRSPSTVALYVTVVRRFFEWCEDEGLVRVSPAARLRRPRRPRPEDVDVVSVSSDDVRRMLAACQDWQERICLNVVVYMGVRRSAAANARRRDVDLDTGYMRFREKGGKTIEKPVPDELLALLRQADGLGQWPTPDAYLIPNRKPWLVKSPKRRGSKIIYETVVRVAERAGVRSHVHALRAAFAVQFDEANPGNALALQELLGHASYDTTKRHYLRRRDKKAAMEPVRMLSFGLPANALVPPAGFEPALQPQPEAEPARPEPRGLSLPDALRARAHEHTISEEPPRRVDDLEDAQATREKD